MAFGEPEHPAHNEDSPPGQVILAIDLGKTSCRVRATSGNLVLASAEGSGAPGLAAPDGDDLAYNAITKTIGQLPGGALAGLTACGVGAAGVQASNPRARNLARKLSDKLGTPIAVVTDVLAAHIGAFRGASGTVLVAGTGAVAYGLSEDGTLTRSDGWGPWLGDDGSGRWIGQQGLHHALSHRDNRGPFTSLGAAAAEIAGHIDNLPSWVESDGEPARTIASFAPTVLKHAAAGDKVAREIADHAAQLLAKTARSATALEGQVAVLGGLVQHQFFRQLLCSAILRVGLQPVLARSDALTGAAMIATNTTLPHERYTTRE